jgi:hypothetical protein
MNKKTRLNVLLAYALLIGFLSFVPVHGLPLQIPDDSRNNDQSNKVAQGIKEIKEMLEKEESFSAPPLYTEVEFSSIIGDIFINPLYTGRIITVRTLLRTGPPRNKPSVDIKEISDGWEKMTVSESESDAIGLIATGKRGSLKISVSKGRIPTGVDKLKPLGDLIISFGELSATLITPEITISKPSSFEIGILDYKENKFINGDIVAIRDNQVAVKFHDLPPAVVNQDGMIRVSLKEPGGTFINADLRAWGYNIFVSETNIKEPAPIKAEVFGLPKDTRLKFTFEPLIGQKITQSSSVLTVEEVNSGKPLGTIVTEIPGAQPLSVLVEKVD